MTLFEYLAIAFSLVLSSSAMRLIRALSHALQRDRRYWVHVAILITQLSVTLAVFWALWSLRHVAWTFPKFALALASPVCVYAAACALVPDDPSAVPSWRRYYFANRVPYFSYVACWAVVVATTTSLLLNMSWSHPARYAQAFAFLSAVLGIFSSQERVHSLIAVLYLAAFPIAMFFSVLSRPS